MLLQLTDLSQEPLYHQIWRQISEKIISGDIKAGEELLPPPAFARTNRTSIATIRRAYQLLYEQGLIEYTLSNSVCVSPLSDKQKHALSIQSTPGSFHDQSEELKRSSVDEELAKARRMQERLFPKAELEERAFALLAYKKPPGFVTGDFYDYFKIDEKRFGFIIADVCGKGLPAAILVAQIQAITRNELQNQASISKTLYHLNRQIRAFAPRSLFVTLFYAIYNHEMQTLEYVNAGHLLPILIHPDGSYNFLCASSSALGLQDQPFYPTAKCDFKPKDILFLYTDGLTECMNSSREELGEEQILRLLLANRHRELPDIRDRILQHLEKFACGGRVDDDVTFMMIRQKDRERPE
jgi:serine phosphatase RsbU (regulator of sigma subunit)